jgi:hypothetical protein
VAALKSHSIAACARNLNDTIDEWGGLCVTRCYETAPEGATIDECMNVEVLPPLPPPAPPRRPRPRPGTHPSSGGRYAGTVTGYPLSVTSETRPASRHRHQRQNFPLERARCGEGGVTMLTRCSFSSSSLGAGRRGHRRQCQGALHSGHTLFATGLDALHLLEPMMSSRYSVWRQMSRQRRWRESTRRRRKRHPTHGHTPVPSACELQR